MSSYFSVQREQATLGLTLKGRWTVAELSEIRHDLELMTLDDVKKATVHGQALEELDTSAAWYLHDLILRLQERGIMAGLRDFKDHHRHLYERIARLPHEEAVVIPYISPARALIIAIGQHFAGIWRDCYQGIGFLGEFFVAVPAQIFHPKGFRFRSIVFHINEIGVKATPIIALMAFSIAFVVGYQGAFQLQKFDATIYTVDLIVLSTLREMGVLITAIMIAGRSGSAFAAQIGTMKLNEEIDALQTMGVSPFQALVLPRLFAILIALLYRGYRPKVLRKTWDARPSPLSYNRSFW
ncbi:MAG: ABC transporter permease [Proteobacteria bacterium]|nr:ABC transporter permease [Pseudomonadota bacterium]